MDHLIVPYSYTTESDKQSKCIILLQKKHETAFRHGSGIFWNTKGCNSNRTLGYGDYIKSSTKQVHVTYNARKVITQLNSY